ncbi:hypothetical protein BJY01DRAFT_255892 [Aspergillus pseudoustus]|uniref:Azaphilone pigments biosynthesis cluster protein L N-terminal domain-containing protein n=1 Tax=Aspergillus pseudoustus TaxID=1810923 RepID=A0ABR4IGP8_9EURO
MTDPFSVSAGVVGVVSLGLTLGQGFLRYYGPWKDCDDAIRGFTAKVDGLLGILHMMSDFLSPENTLQLSSNQYPALVLKNVAVCEEACRRLEKMLAECQGSKVSNSTSVRKHEWLRFNRAVYPLRKETLTTLSQLVSDLQDNLNLAFHLLNNAMMSHQQKQIQELVLSTSSIDLTATKILTVVERQGSVVASQAVDQAIALSLGNQPHAVRSMPEPSTLQELCHQQQLINSWLRRRRKLPSSAIDQMLHNCTCSRKPRFSPRSFSTFVLHETKCPLFMEGQTVLGIAGNLTFCNRFLGQSIQVMMTLTRGAGALAISPVIQMHAVVHHESPAFKAIYDAIPEVYAQGPRNIKPIIETTRTRLLNVLCQGKSRPTDRLESGETLLHAVCELARTVHGGNPECVDLYKALVRVLIDAGVPLNECTITGATALDIFIYRFRRKGLLSKVEMAVARELLSSGGLLNSSARHMGRMEFSYGALQAVCTLFATNPEGFEFSDIEIALLSKSPALLERCLSLPERQQCDAAIPGESEILYLSLGWPEAMSKLLKRTISLTCSWVDRCFVDACQYEQIESALTLVPYIGVIQLRHLYCAVSSENTTILKSVISAIVMARTKLQVLAVRHLPPEVLRSFSLPNNTLLDTNAFSVYQALRERNITVLDPCWDQDSVYASVRGHHAALELLYEAGFTDLNQSSAAGITPLMTLDLRWRSSWWGLWPFFDDAPRKLWDVAAWMVHKGANLCQCSHEGYPATWYLAEKFGADYARGFWGIFVDENHIRSDVRGQHPDSRRILCSILTDDFTDDCLCACSERGCTGWTRILRAWEIDLEASGNHKSLFSVLAEEAQQVSSEAFTEHDKARIAHQLIRYLTFEALELTHTCHTPGRERREREEPMDPEEIDEIRDEEAEIIAQLEELVVDLTRTYEDLGVSIYEFIFKHWWPRIDEVAPPPEDADPEEVKRVRAAGVVFDESSDWGSESQDVNEED